MKVIEPKFMLEYEEMNALMTLVGKLSRNDEKGFGLNDKEISIIEKIYEEFSKLEYLEER